MDNILSDRKIKSAADGVLFDGGGLYLRKAHKGSGRWIYRYTAYGKRSEMGLGGWPTVSLAEARADRSKWRSYLSTTKQDPKKERDRIAAANNTNRLNTLNQLSEQTFEAKKSGLKGDGVAGRWLSPVTLHVLPKLGAKPIVEITQNDIKNALAPIWKSKAETAKKAVRRLGIIFDHARATGLDVTRETVKTV